MNPFNGGGLGSAGLGGGGVFTLASIVLLVAIILVLVAGRPADDRAGTRTQARYLGTITLLSLFIGLFAFFGVVRNLSDLIVEHQDHQSAPSGIPKELQDLYQQLAKAGQGNLPIPGLDAGRDGAVGRSDDADYRGAMRAGLLGLAAAGIFVFHKRRARKLVPADKFPSDATGRVARAALYGACAVAALIALLAAARGVYGLFRIVAPGVAGSADADIGREQGVAEFISFGLLALASAFIFLRAWYWMPEHRE